MLASLGTFLQQSVRNTRERLSTWMRTEVLHDNLFNFLDLGVANLHEASVRNAQASSPSYVLHLASLSENATTRSTQVA